MNPAPALAPDLLPVDQDQEKDQEQDIDYEHDIWW
jgi:hypothetical protein